MFMISSLAGFFAGCFSAVLEFLAGDEGSFEEEESEDGRVGKTVLGTT